VLGRLVSGLPPGAQQFLRFAVAGGLGTVTNLVLFFLIVDLGGVAPLLGMLLCFGVAASQNYLLNELWTFATGSTARLSLRRYGKFVAASLAGLAVNAVALIGLLAMYDFPFAVIPQAGGIAAGMLFNFAVARWYIFRRPTDAAGDQISE
jgi:putative flippase GtrA